MKNNQPMTRPDSSVDTKVVYQRDKLRQRSPSIFWAWVILILAVLYLISPIDIIPDVIPILGWIDDVVVTLSAIIIALPKIINR
jgi:uncharacterized membrane protein YkvA (DUF1232 family)